MLLEGLARARVEKADTGKTGGAEARNPAVLHYNSADVDMGAVAEKFTRIDIVVDRLEEGLRASRSVALSRQRAFHSPRECTDHDH